MNVAYWEPPAQGVYHAKIHIALKDGQSFLMLCGKRPRPTWCCTSLGPGRWLCRSCEHRQLSLRRAELQEALDHSRKLRELDESGVPRKYADVRYEYREGFEAGMRGRGQEFPCTGPDSAPLYYERLAAWEAGVRAGRKARRAKQ
jgi:hypothetical protein